MSAAFLAFDLCLLTGTATTNPSIWGWFRDPLVSERHLHDCYTSPIGTTTGNVSAEGRIGNRDQIGSVKVGVPRGERKGKAERTSTIVVALSSFPVHTIHTYNAYILIHYYIQYIHTYIQYIHTLLHTIHTYIHTNISCSLSLSLSLSLSVCVCFSVQVLVLVHTHLLPPPSI